MNDSDEKRPEVVEIVTEYLGMDDYHLTVIVDGVCEESLPVKWWAITKARSKACARWAQVADLVTATEIPFASDMRNAVKEEDL